MAIHLASNCGRRGVELRLTQGKCVEPMLGLDLPIPTLQNAQTNGSFVRIADTATS